MCMYLMRCRYVGSVFHHVFCYAWVHACSACLLRHILVQIANKQRASNRTSSNHPLSPIAMDIYEGIMVMKISNDSRHAKATKVNSPSNCLVKIKFSPSKLAKIVPHLNLEMPAGQGQPPNRSTWSPGLSGSCGSFHSVFRTMAILAAGFPPLLKPWSSTNNWDDYKDYMYI